MYIRALTIEEFKLFIENHPMRNYCQTIDYALTMTEYGFEYELIGYGTDSMLCAASLILYKKINKTFYYGYAPKGFIIDYTDEQLIENFSNKLADYFVEKDCIFIKINPEIAIGEINKKDFNTEYNRNYNIIGILQRNGYKKLKNNLNFESLFPRFTGIISLKNFSINTVKKNTRNKIKKGLRKGLVLTKVEIDKLKIIQSFFPEADDFYYNDLYDTFHKSGNADLFLVTVDAEKYLINSQDAYTKETNINNYFNDKIVTKQSKQNINNKMNSDKTLLSYKNDIAEASKLMDKNETIYLAAALVIKDGTRIIIHTTGFNRNYKRFAPNYFLHYALLEYYKDTFLYADLNGLSGDFSKENKYYGINKFKMGFNPKIFELIGEFDLIINENLYNYLLKSGALTKEFNN